MHATELDAQELGALRQASTNLTPLSELERDLLEALTDEAVCTSVLHARARLLKGLTPTTKRDRDRIVAACEELVRRGLAARKDAPRTVWWHRSEAAQSGSLI
jgi:hypothetical protein